MISLIHTYEGGKEINIGGVSEPECVGSSDSTLYNRYAGLGGADGEDLTTSSCGSGTPGAKVNINDSDHSYYYVGFLDSSGNVQNQSVRNYVWENFQMNDPCVVHGSGMKSTDEQQSELCVARRRTGYGSGPDAKYNNFRGQSRVHAELCEKMDWRK